MTRTAISLSLLLPVVAATHVIGTVTTTACQDNPRFRFQGVNGYDCTWLGKQPENLCDWEMVSPRESKTPFVPTSIGQVHCPVSCGYCDVDTTTVDTDQLCYNSKMTEVVVSFENESPMPRDWVGIYSLLTTKESLEVGSILTEEPVAWSWLCDIDESGTPNSHSKDAAPSANCKVGYNQVIFRDLPRGVYQAVLVRKNDEIIASSTSAFEVLGKHGEPLSEMCSDVEQPQCLDKIRTREHCYHEGDDFSVLLQNECDLVQPEDWFAFFRAEDCSDADQICFGEPVIWSMACLDDEKCHRLSTEYRFRSKTLLLPAGDYRVALVAADDDLGEAPYFVRLLSQPMQINRQGEACQLVERQS